MAEQRRKQRMVIRASEIAQYLFCPMSWYLSRKGYTPDEQVFAKGVQVHHRHAQVISHLERGQQWAKRLLLLGSFLLLIGALLIIVEVI